MRRESAESPELFLDQDLVIACRRESTASPFACSLLALTDDSNGK